MRGNIREFVRIVSETLTIQQPVVEIGALQVAGQQYDADLRPLFAHADYTGCDIRSGPGVDRVEDVHQLSFASDTLGTVLMLETLEHVRNPLQAMAEVYRVLRPGGLVVISSVMDYPVHEHPADYWRFPPQGFDLLLEAFAPRRVYLQGLPLFPHSVVGIGIKPGQTDVAAGQAGQAEFDRLDQRARTIPGSLTQEISPRLGRDPFRLLGEELSEEERPHYPAAMLHVACDQLLQKDEEIARLEHELRCLREAHGGKGDEESRTREHGRASPPHRQHGSRLSSTAPGFDYSDYEFELRDRQLNRDMLAGYVSHFQGCDKVLDLACGSGIFLELLAEQGIPALGVERNPTVAAWVKQHGWDVVEQDVLTFLEQTAETYDGVFCSHFLEHLPFAQVVRCLELLASRVTPAGTVVIVVPNPESIRMQLFGFWRDPEHVRFYHPELLETVCRHAGLQVTYTNRAETPFAIAPPALPSVAGTDRNQVAAPQRGGLKETLRAAYLRFLRLLRITPAADLVAVEGRFSQHLHAQRDAIAAWAEKTHEAVHWVWDWPDNAVLVCRKTDAAPGDRAGRKPGRPGRIA